MKPKHVKGRRRKEARMLLKEQRLLHKKLWNLGYYELEKPIRHGWFKEVELTEKVERYKN